MVIIDAELTAPPSEVSLFRDITLYSNCFLEQKVVIECMREERDYYYKWLKDKCAWDYVEDMIRPRTEEGFSLRIKRANVVVPRISYQNYVEIIKRLNIYRAK